MHILNIGERYFFLDPNNFQEAKFNFGYNSIPVSDIRMEIKMRVFSVYSIITGTIFFKI